MSTSDAIISRRSRGKEAWRRLLPTVGLMFSIVHCIFEELETENITPGCLCGAVLRWGGICKMNWHLPYILGECFYNAVVGIRDYIMVQKIRTWSFS